MSTQHPQPDEFVRLFMAHQRRILSFVATLVPNLADAEDVVQEVSTVHWEKFDQFEPGRDFAAWAFRIARFKVMELRRQQQRPMVFDESLIEQIADDAAEMSAELSAQQTAMDDCVEQLSDEQRELIELRYRQQEKLSVVAGRVGRSVETVRQRLRRIYKQLEKCITGKLDDQGF